MVKKKHESVPFELWGPIFRESHTQPENTQVVKSRTQNQRTIYNTESTTQDRNKTLGLSNTGTSSRSLTSLLYVTGGVAFATLAGADGARSS